VSQGVSTLSNSIESNIAPPAMNTAAAHHTKITFNRPLIWLEYRYLTAQLAGCVDLVSPDAVENWLASPGVIAARRNRITTKIS
jgi:hypothetical protein